MDLSSIDLQMVSIVLEGLVAVLAFLAARRGRTFMYGLALTFGIYVYYDAARYFGWQTLAPATMEVVFLIATLSALWAVWSIYRRRY